MSEYKEGSLWLTFRLDGKDFCILSKYVESISIPSEITPTPNLQSTLTGVTPYANKIIGVIEMRALFGMESLKDYTDQFGIMKDMHVSWIEDLSRYVKEGGEFTKAVNPHKCKFGIWYDSFKTDNNRLNRLLKKINAPHEHIHNCGAEIVRMRSQYGDFEAEISEKFADAEDVCINVMLPLLDRLIDIYKTVNRGVLLVLYHKGLHVGLLVDDVRSLIPCSKTTQQEFDNNLSHTQFVRQIIMSDKQVLLEVDVEAILENHQEEDLNLD